MGSYLLNRNEEILSEKVRETLSNHLFRKSGQIDDWMWQRTREVTRWSASFVVFEGVEALTLKTGDVERAQRDLNEYLASILGHYQTYESLFVTDAQGRILATTRNEQWEGFATPLLARPEAAKAGVVSPLHRSAFLGRPTLLALHAIQDRNDKNVGFLVERPDLRELLLLLNPAVGDPAPEFWLLDDNGRVLLRTGQLPPNPGTEQLPVVTPVPPEEAGPVVEATLPTVGRVVYGVRRLAGPSGGYLAATVPARVAYRSLDEARLRMLILGAVVLVVVLLITFFAARNLLRPVLLLSEGAQRLSRGEDVSLPVAGSDELADLTRTFNDMSTKMREARQRLESLAITDELTQLYNRRHFGDTLEKEMRRSLRDDKPLSLLLLDLDHFKQFNDRWGHTEGDAELSRAADIVMKSIRSTDSAFRYGGEELTVLLPSCPKHQALLVAEKIRAAVNSRPSRPAVTEKPFTTVSIGVATFPEDGQGARALVDAADAALYAAKARGRDRVVVAGDEAAPAEKAARR